jgi:hypothetical protein
MALVPLLTIFAGCQQPANLRPFASAAGAYALMQKPEPQPSPTPSGCVEKCRCAGTGVEKSGDGLTNSPCRCPDNCGCKAKKVASAPCTTGTCAGWPPKNISR